jgi:hypothetical protein
MTDDAARNEREPQTLEEWNEAVTYWKRRSESAERDYKETLDAGLRNISLLLVQEQALEAAKEFVRTAKFKFEGIGPHTTAGEINQWIYERDIALRRITAALEVSSPQQKESADPLGLDAGIPSTGQEMRHLRPQQEDKP